jgi:penicillin-binding protein 2
MTIDEALQVMTIRHALHEKGYLKFDPIKIASNISKETAIMIEETKMDLPGISIDIEPIRMYPEKSTAAHVLGYLGSISSENEVTKYVEELGYNRNQLIGKTGIEGAFEETLTGVNGERYIVVDALGNYLRDATLEQDGVTSIPTKAGEDIHLTIDTDLQQKLETYLERAIDAISEGGAFASKWGDYKYNDAYENAQSGAGVVVNVKTGEVLAIASYPAYDVNLFSTGITAEDWQALSPVNPRNPLEARPLYNVATLTAVQPGSTFKMVTGYAALAEGLSASQKIFTNGYIDIGNQRYGCWIWNSYRSRHGPADLYHALETSCNYYFFDVATGYDYYRNRPLPFDMNTEKLVAYAKAFGLDDPTGIEIGESVRGVPDPDKKKRTILALLRGRLEVILEDYFPQEVVTDKKKLATIIDEILSWADDNPSRAEIIRRLTALGAKDDYTLVGKLADYIKYSHFNFLEWYEGDTFNLAIGQGDHEYTPVQMARYIAAIANGGDVMELTLLKDNPVSVISTLEPEHLEPLREGMRLVAHGSAGTSRTLWNGFPIEVGAKTGTAEKEGTIPPLDEVAYLTDHLDDFAPGMTLEAVEERTSELLKARNEELAGLERAIEQTDDQEEREAMASELESLITGGYLNKGRVMRQAIKDLYDGRLSDEKIDAYRQQYDNYSWYVSFAPFDDPEIAVVVMIPQGGSGGYSGPVVREIIGDYFNLTPSVNP